MSFPRSDCQSKLPSPVIASCGLVELGVQPDELAHQPRPGHPARTAGEQRGTETACGSGARLVAHVHAERGGERVGEPRERGVQLGDRGVVGALLRPEHRGRAVPAQQRVVDVGGRHEPHSAELDGAVQPGAAGERGAATGQRGAAVVHGHCAERGQHPGAAVGGGRAAQPDDDLGDARVARVRDQLADPARGDRRARPRAPAAPAGTRCSPHAAADSR